MNVVDNRQMLMTEMRMIRMMCGKTLLDKIANNVCENGLVLISLTNILQGID